MNPSVAHKLLVCDPDELDAARLDEGLVLSVRDGDGFIGATISETIKANKWRFDLPTVCRVRRGDDAVWLYYGRDEWATFALSANDNLEFVSMPMGGGGGGQGKQIGAAIALITLAVLAPYAVAGIGGAAFGTITGATVALTTLGTIASSLLVIGGSLAISHFLKPKAANKGNAVEDIFSIAFQGNAARPLQPIPCQYGKTLSTPDFAAPKYSLYNGDLMTEYVLISMGIGKHRIDEIRFGDTTVWTNEDGVVDGYAGLAIDLYDPDEQVTLFPVNIVTSNDIAGIELDMDYTPWFAVNAPNTEAKELLFDFVWPAGAFISVKDKTLPNPQTIKCLIRPINDAGVAIGGESVLFENSYNFAKQSQIRRTERYAVTPGRYEVRVTMTGILIDTLTGADTIIWSAMRASIDAPQSFPVSTIAIRVEANDSVSGVNNSQIGVISTRYLTYWNGSTFVEGPSQSIAWAAYDMWVNQAGLSASQLDLTSFIAYDTVWGNLDHTFNHVFKEAQNLDDALETILRAGRAMPAFIGDRLTIVRDEERTVPRMVFTDYDIVKDSFSIEYVIADETFADGIVGEYLDRDTWRPAEVSSAPDGETLAKPSRIQLQGVTKRAQAAGFVRFQAAESQYRRQMVNWTTKMEGRLLKRGDLVLLSCEEAQDWGQSCEIVEFDYDNAILVLDPAPTWADSGSHFMRVRGIDASPTESFHVEMDGDDPSRAYVVNAGVLDDIADAVARGDNQDRAVAVFSVGVPQEYAVLITEGEPDSDGEHIALKGVIDNPLVYDVVETGVTPQPLAPDNYSKILPEIGAIGAVIRQRQLALILSVGWQPVQNAATYVVDVSYDDGDSYSPFYQGAATTCEGAVGGSDDVRVRVAGITPSGRRGRYSTTTVVAPDLVVSNEYAGVIYVDHTDLRAQLGEEIRLISDRGEATLSDLRDKVENMVEALAGANADSMVASQTDNRALHAARKTDLGTNLALIVEERTVRATADSAMASSILTLGATVDDNLALLVEEQTVRATADSALATSITSLGATVDDNLALLVDEQTVRATADSALSESIEVVSTTVGEHTATLTEQSISIDGIQAQYGVSITIDSVSGGFIFTGIRQLDGSVAFAFKISGDLLVDGTIRANHLAVETLITNSAQMGDLTVDHLTIQGGAVSQCYAAADSDQNVDLDLDCRAGATVLLMTSFFGAAGTYFALGTGNGVLSIAVNGVDQSTVVTNFEVASTAGPGAIALLQTFHFAIYGIPSDGTYNFSAYNTNSAGIGGIGIVVTELAR